MVENIVYASTVSIPRPSGSRNKYTLTTRGVDLILQAEVYLGEDVTKQQKLDMYGEQFLQPKEQGAGNNDMVKLLHHELSADLTAEILEHIGADSATFCCVGSTTCLVGALQAGIKCLGFARNQAHKKW